MPFSTPMRAEVLIDPQDYSGPTEKLWVSYNSEGGCVTGLTKREVWRQISHYNQNPAEWRNWAKEKSYGPS